MVFEITEFDEALTVSNLNDYQRIWFRERYLTMLGRLQIAYGWTRIWFWIFTTTITIGSVSLVMLTSLGAVGFNDGWVITMVSIIVSFAVALANKFLYAGNNIQKKYINDRQTLEKVRAEGWKFIGRVGKYSGGGDAFQRFVSRVETIRASYVSENIAIINSQIAGSANNSLVHADNTTLGNISNSNADSNANSNSNAIGIANSNGISIGSVDNIGNADNNGNANNNGNFNHSTTDHVIDINDNVNVSS